MQMLFVTVRGPQRTIDLELPGDVPIKELLPTLISLCVSSAPGSSQIQTDVYAWGLGVDDASALLPVSSSLLAGKVVNGAILQLRKLSQVSGFKPKEKFTPKTIQPAGAGGIGIRWSKDGLLNG